MKWDRALEPCFSAEDSEFAFTPVQIDEALNWVRDLRAKDRTWNDARDQIASFLKARNADSRHVKRQVERARALVRPWLM
jgi:hypothetical protein